MTFRRIAFTVPGQPVAKGRARAFVRNGRVGHHTPEKTVRYESTVALAAQQAMAGAALITGPVQLNVIASFQIPSSWSRKKRDAAVRGDLLPTGRPDVDNVGKAICDGCNGVVFADDAQVVTMHLRKRYAEQPGVSVVVEGNQDA